MGIELTQVEADTLLAMQKRRTESDVLLFPGPGGKLVVPLQSIDKTEDFFLDVTRSRIDLVKITYQNRGRSVVVLMRLDIHGAPHRNPDGAEIPCPHLHLYREGYGDKWAVPLNDGRFPNLEDQVQTLIDFMRECNVVDHPTVQRGIF